MKRKLRFEMFEHDLTEVTVVCHDWARRNRNRRG